MVGSKIICLVVLSLPLFESSIQMPNDFDMEISECLKGNQSINGFILNNFIKVDSAYKNPIFPYKINCRSNIHKLTFCNLPVIESWVIKNGHSYAFFMLLRNRPDLVKSISDKYGNHEIESKIEINNSSLPTTYYWHIKELNIIVENFFNIWKVANYNNCSLVIAGNMEYKDLVHLPDQ